MTSSIAPPAQIGFVGLGQMGAPMARNLARAGFALQLCDLDRAVAARVAREVGGSAKPSVADISSDCAAVIAMLPDGQAVRAVAEQLRLASGGVVIDMSSSAPVGTRELGAMLAERGIALVDAPVSGGVKRAVDASLAIMAGGDGDAIERVRPLLEALGKRIFLTGPLGSGHAMKALNNYVSAAGLAAATEAVLAGSRFGLDPAVIVEVLNASTGKNNSTENKFPQFILPRTFAAGFSLGLMVKDLRTALGVAHASGTPAPLAETCVAVWIEAERALGPQADHTAVVQYWEALAGAEIPRRDART